MVVIRYHIQNPSEKRNPFSLMIRTERAICIKDTEAISKKNNAQNETRTHTPLPELGPEPSASTNSAIWANLKKMVTCIEIKCQARLALEEQSYYTFHYD